MKTLFISLLIVVLGMTAMAQTKGRVQLKVNGLSNVLMTFEANSAYLNYLSESDADVHNYISPMVANVITNEEFLRVNMLPANTVISQVDFEEWTDHQGQFDSSGRWDNLRIVMESQLGNVVVFKVGTVQVQYFAVGLYQNRFVGVRTYGIET